MTRSRRAAVVLMLIAAGLVALGADVAIQRLHAPLPPATVALHAPAGIVPAPGTPPAIPVPLAGSMEVAGDDPGSGGAALASLDGGTQRPIGSLAKAMTALMVLQARPLGPDATGPVVTMTSQDVSLYQQALAEDGSTVAVSAGEQLSERDLLLALMLPSANNIAETLGNWVAGSHDDFVARLNAAAASLAMTRTHFVDPSGYSPLTVSSAHDLVILARAALANPTLRAVVATQSATLPDGTRLQNLDILLGSHDQHWLGIKTGWTPQAGGCLLFAAQREYNPQAAPVTVYGAVLGQPPDPVGDAQHPELGGAMRAARQAMSAALAGYVSLDLRSLQVPISGAVTTAWGTASAVQLSSPTPAIAVLRIGTALTLRNALHFSSSLPAPSGTSVGTVTAAAGATAVAWWAVQTTAALAGAPWWWRLQNG